MGWEYRNINTTKIPPCPVCGTTSLVEKPAHPNGRYICKVAKCSVTFQAKWKPDEHAGVVR